MRKFIGNKAFYILVLSVAVPIMVQNGITNFVNLLDNLMVGQIGTEQMSGVSIINHLIFVFNVCIFGACSGAGIFCAQYYGTRDFDGIRYSFRFKLIACIIMCAVATLLFKLKGDTLISLFLNDAENPGQLALTLKYARDYLDVIILILVPHAIAQAYASTQRETGETVLPMIAGIAAVITNLVFNYILIFGKFGFPVMGVKGAALATFISKLVEMGICVGWTHLNKDKNPYAVGLYRSFKIAPYVAAQITKKGTPLILNEILWSMGTATLIQCYSIRGLNVVAGVNIASTVYNLFNLVFMALGSAVSIIVGQQLGAGELEKAKDSAVKLIFFAVVSCSVVGLVIVALSGVFPEFYNTTAEVKEIARLLIIAVGIYMPIQAFNHTSYFTMRSGGQTIVTFLFDSVFMWVVAIPFAFVLSRFTALPIFPLYLACHLIEIIKSFIGAALIKKGVWIRKIV